MRTNEELYEKAVPGTARPWFLIRPAIDSWQTAGRK